MTKGSCKISCDTCNTWVTRYNESGGTTGYKNPFDCRHFHCSIYTDHNMGFFFGTNAMVYFEVDVRCEKCKRRFNSWQRYRGYGTSTDTRDFYCCGNRLHIIYQKA